MVAVVVDTLAAVVDVLSVAVVDAQWVADTVAAMAGVMPGAATATAAIAAAMDTVMVAASAMDTA
jgi:hypothetical protein